LARIPLHYQRDARFGEASPELSPVSLRESEGGHRAMADEEFPASSKQRN